jgi:hypothetical protein
MENFSKIVYLLSLSFVISCQMNDGINENVNNIKDNKSEILDHKEHNKSIKSDCRDEQLEMGSGQICTFESTTLKDVYVNFTETNSAIYSNYLDRIFPLKNKEVNIKKNGLISINYKWDSHSKLIITVFFDGGTTEISFELKGSNVERRVYNFAD